ncbi:hypothetical protein CYY_005709 [Polysphondylium violaceum]|uniref:Leucine-rich repeat-containing protein n=1 Tax=Polysphondylium violaceum TaxID=133409 RepID=A0A8J4PVW2_9MYCE|nr:hypothetical protein CYY_005709 [Polysphondylium violaceum]
MAEPEIEKKFIEDSLGQVGGLFGESICHSVWVDANKSPTSAGSGFNKRLIVVGKYKLLSLKKGTFGKSVELEFHLYNIQEICQTEGEDVITIKYQGENGEALGITIKGAVEKLSMLIKELRTSYRRITVGFGENYLMKLNVPDSKILDLPEPFIPSAALGYIDCYIAHSYFYKTVGTLDFVRYIESLATSDGNTTELDFTQCAGIDPNSELSFNLFTAIASLRHNTYFKSIVLSTLPHANIINALGMCLETNKTISKLAISNLRIEQSFQALANGLNKNPDNAIQALDFSKNTITYPVMVTLCDCFSKFSHGLVSLNLSKCDLQPRNITILFESFERNFGMSLQLKYLNLSHSKFGDVGSQSIASWMSKIKGHHSLECLVLSNCQLNFSIMGPPLRVVDVARLDLSNNRIDRAASKLFGSEVFDTVGSLTDLNLSGCGMNAESLEDIFVSFNRNRKIANFQINLSRNNLGSREATILSKSISGCRYLEALDISFNKLNCRSLMELLGAIKNIDQFNLHELNFSNNYFVQGPEGDQFCAQLAQLINNFPTVRTVNLSGGKYPLGKSLTPLLDALIKNKSLKELDISENGLTDSMASIVGEMLRNNTSLMYLNLDNNNFGLSGWSAIAQPLLFDINRTLNFLVFTKTLASAYTSTIIQNFTLHQAFGSLSTSKRQQVISLFQKMQDKLAENRFETSVVQDSINLYVSEYATTPIYQVSIPDHVTPLAPVPEHLSQLPPPPSPQSAIDNSSLNVSKGFNSSKLNLSNLNIESNGASTTEKKAGHQRSDSRDSVVSSLSSHVVSGQHHSHHNGMNGGDQFSGAAPPRALSTHNSDAVWHPDEQSEMDIYEESNGGSFVNYSSEDDFSGSEASFQTSEAESLGDRKTKIKSNMTKQRSTSSNSEIKKKQQMTSDGSTSSQSPLNQTPPQQRKQPQEQQQQEHQHEQQQEEEVSDNLL